MIESKYLKKSYWLEVKDAVIEKDERVLHQAIGASFFLKGIDDKDQCKRKLFGFYKHLKNKENQKQTRKNKRDYYQEIRIFALSTVIKYFGIYSIIDDFKQGLGNFDVNDIKDIKDVIAKEFEDIFKEGRRKRKSGGRRGRKSKDITKFNKGFNFNFKRIQSNPDRYIPLLKKNFENLEKDLSNKKFSGFINPIKTKHQLLSDIDSFIALNYSTIGDNFVEFLKDWFEYLLGNQQVKQLGELQDYIVYHKVFEHNGDIKKFIIACGKKRVYDLIIKLINDETEKIKEIDKFKKKFSSTSNINRALILRFSNDWIIYYFDSKGSFNDLKLNSNDELARELGEEGKPKNRNKFIEKLTSKLGHTQKRNEKITKLDTQKGNLVVAFVDFLNCVGIDFTGIGNLQLKEIIDQENIAYEIYGTNNTNNVVNKIKQEITNQGANLQGQLGIQKAFSGDITLARFLEDLLGYDDDIDNTTILFCEFCKYHSEGKSKSNERKETLIKIITQYLKIYVKSTLNIIINL